MHPVSRSTSGRQLSSTTSGDFAIRFATLEEVTSILMRMVENLKIIAYKEWIPCLWKLTLIYLLLAKTVAEQEAEHGLFYQSATDLYCNLCKVEPRFMDLVEYDLGVILKLSEPAKSRIVHEEFALFTLLGAQLVLRLVPLTCWILPMSGIPINNFRYPCF
jgi:hypothetical protein